MPFEYVLLSYIIEIIETREVVLEVGVCDTEFKLLVLSVPQSAGMYFNISIVVVFANKLRVLLFTDRAECGHLMWQRSSLLSQSIHPSWKKSG